MDAEVVYLQTTSKFPSWTFLIGSACFALRRKALQPSRISRFQKNSVRLPLQVRTGQCGSETMIALLTFWNFLVGWREFLFSILLANLRSTRLQSTIGAGRSKTL